MELKINVSDQLSRDEIQSMFLLTDIKQTRDYQEAREEGKQKGETQILLRQLSKRFGAMGSRCIQAINQLSLEQLEDLGEALLDFDNVAELDNWLKSRVAE